MELISTIVGIALFIFVALVLLGTLFICMYIRRPMGTPAVLVSQQTRAGPRGCDWGPLRVWVPPSHLVLGAVSGLSCQQGPGHAWPWARLAPCSRLWAGSVPSTYRRDLVTESGPVAP